jgi:S-adenosylmethionine decarboxylase proenzyme
VELKALGQHLLIELHDCDPTALNDLSSIRNTMLDAARTVCATVIGVTEHRFSPQGVTVVVVIAESHLSIHTWPEHSYAAVDVFTCGHGLVTSTVVDLLSERLGAGHVSAVEIQRGILSGRASARKTSATTALPVATRVSGLP